MAETIGQKLQKEREQRGWSIADVAHDTRIHPDTIRGLETDDYSVFASTTYAKSFLLLYSRHLEVDADEALHDFGQVAQQLNKSGSVCLAPSATNVEAGESIRPHEISQHRATSSAQQKQPLPLFLVVAVLLLLLIIPTFYFIGKKADSFEEAATILNETISNQKTNSSDKQADGETSSSTDKSTAALQPSEPSPADIEFLKHRFPRPASESDKEPKKPQSKTTALPPNQIKATPVAPK
ncbi:MAG: helix-turn-helix transcriptional regulator [Verrucomicrobiota bacterium]